MPTSCAIVKLALTKRDMIPTTITKLPKIYLFGTLAKEKSKAPKGVFNGLAIQFTFYGHFIKNKM